MASRSLVWGIAAVVACAHAGAAAAQEARPPSPPGPARDALLIGFGVHAGSLVADCDDAAEVECDWDAGGADVHIGWFLTRELGLMLDVWGMYHTEDNLTIHQVIATAAAQYWLTPRLWIKGGVGNARAGYRWDGVLVDVRDQTENVPGVMIGAGYEIVLGRSFVMDVQVRYGTGNYEDTKGHNAGVGLGFNWY